MAETPHSKLPREAGYWDRLARTIGDDAEGPLAAYRASAGVADDSWTGAAGAGSRDADHWDDLLAERATWLVAASAAAMLILWLAIPAPASDPTDELRWMEASLVPDERAGTLISGPAPPHVNDLMVQFPPVIEDEEGPQ